MPKSKPSALNDYPVTEFYPAVLKNYPNAGWRIEYYVLNPQTQTMVRRQMKLNLLRSRYPKASDFRRHANEIVFRLNAKLRNGWSPLMEQENNRLYVRLDDVLHAYIDEKRRELRPDTLRSYASFASIFGAWCQEQVPKIYASLFSKLLAVRYLDYIYAQRKVGIRAWNNQLKMGRAFFSWAFQKCYVKENPFETIKTKREPPKRRVLIPADVRQRIADYYEQHNPYMLTVCELVFTSLIRPKEIQCIRLGDIDLEGKFIRMAAENAKTHNERFCALSPQLIERLRPLFAQRLPRSYYLFGEKYAPSANPIPAARFRKDWDKMRTTLKLPQEMQLYSLRDTGINNMLKAGIDPLTVMQHADHHDLSMTTRYANHADPALIERINRTAPRF